MRYLILIKHSAPLINPALPASRWVLSREGRRRCRPLAEALAPYAPAPVISSIEPKAQQTGALVAAQLGVARQSRQGLHEHARETVGFLATEVFQQAIGQFFARPDSLVFGEETASQARERFDQAIQSILAEYQEETIAVVAHGTVIALFAAHHAGLEPWPLWQQLGLPSILVFARPGLGLMTMRLEIGAG